MANRTTRASPPITPTRVIRRLHSTGHYNNVLAFHVQREHIRSQLRHRVRTAIRETRDNPQEQKRLLGIHGELKQQQGMAFEGYFPTNDDLGRLERHIQGTEDVDLSVLQYIENLREKIRFETKRWECLQIRGKDLSNLQDMHVAQHLFPYEFGGAVTTFGSARQKPGTASYESVRWLNRVIIGGLMQENGSTERALSGAGPGAMEAANRGAMEGRVDLMNRLEKKIADGGDVSVYEKQMQQIRSEIQSMGIRITLPFEQSFNDHLQFNLAMHNFGARKAALVSATLGRSVNDEAEDEHILRHRRHPAFFVVQPGFGTLDETWEVATLIQCGKMKDAPIILIGKKTREIFERALDDLSEAKTINPADREIFTMTESSNEIDALYAYLSAHNLPETEEIRRMVSAHKKPFVQ